MEREVRREDSGVCWDVRTMAVADGVDGREGDSVLESASQTEEAGDVRMEERECWERVGSLLTLQQALYC